MSLVANFVPLSAKRGREFLIAPFSERTGYYRFAAMAIVPIIRVGPF